MVWADNILMRALKETCLIRWESEDLWWTAKVGVPVTHGEGQWYVAGKLLYQECKEQIATEAGGTDSMN